MKTDSSKLSHLSHFSALNIAYLFCMIIKNMSIFYLLDKAQEVEAELLESHQEETNQLYKRIAEKEDDLKRTAKRYEEILDVPYFLSLEI